MLGHYTTGPNDRLGNRNATNSRGKCGSGDMAGVPGLEPRLTEPETVGLPITPYPNSRNATGPSLSKRFLFPARAPVHAADADSILETRGPQVSVVTQVR